MLLAPSFNFLFLLAGAGGDDDDGEVIVVVAVDDDAYGASLGGTLCFINNPTLRRLLSYLSTYDE